MILFVSRNRLRMLFYYSFDPSGILVWFTVNLDIFQVDVISGGLSGILILPRQWWMFFIWMSDIRCSVAWLVTDLSLGLFFIAWNLSCALIFLVFIWLFKGLKVMGVWVFLLTLSISKRGIIFLLNRRLFAILKTHLLLCCQKYLCSIGSACLQILLLSIKRGLCKY